MANKKTTVIDSDLTKEDFEEISDFAALKIIEKMLKEPVHIRDYEYLYHIGKIHGAITMAIELERGRRNNA